MIKKLGEFTLREIRNICVANSDDCSKCCFGYFDEIGNEMYGITRCRVEFYTGDEFVWRDEMEEEIEVEE